MFQIPKMVPGVCWKILGTRRLGGINIRQSRESLTLPTARTDGLSAKIAPI